MPRDARLSDSKYEYFHLNFYLSMALQFGGAEVGWYLLNATNTTHTCTLTDCCKLTAIYCQMTSPVSRAHACTHIACE